MRYFERGGKEQNKSLPIGDLLAPFLQGRHDFATAKDMRDYVEKLEKDGVIEITPSVEAMRSECILRDVIVWAERATDGGGPRFASDRQGGRINPRIKHAGLLADLERERFIESIRRTLLVEGPAMYRGQAMLLASLDQSVDAARLARECTDAVRQAVIEGVKEARGSKDDQAA